MKTDYRLAADPYRNMSVEELESALPVTVQRTERQQMPCPCCDKERYETVTYRQELYRYDSFGEGNRKLRTYEISFRDRAKSYGELFRTFRHCSFREALIEAHKYLDDNSLKNQEEENNE